jgi:carboxypeptidase Taq
LFAVEYCENRMSDSAYEKLLAKGREIQLVGDAQALLGWDQEVLLPKKGIAYRGEQMAWFSGWAHEQFVSAEVGDWIDEAEAASEDELEKANLREWRHNYNRATCLPKELVEEFAQAKVLSQASWAEARKKSDFEKFAPSLTRLIELCREQAERWGYKDVLYDGLIDRFERGTSTQRISETLGDLRDKLIPVVEEAVATSGDEVPWEGSEFPIEQQRAFNEEVARSIGFDFDAGRVDTAVHPFCSGMAPFDTRLTTRYNVSDFRSSLFGVLHEVGHGLYEQGLNPDHRGQPIGNAVSLGLHESQSRLWENHVGRSRAFWEYWLPRAVEYFPTLGGVSVEQMYASVNQANLSYIRVESDEVTYDLHILLRFEIEKAIFAGELKTVDIPSAWNERFEQYFGLPVNSDSNGCLQDIHWSMGIFGYFPTYSLGNINAAHLSNAALSQSPEIKDQMDRADYSGLLSWMREKIHARGSVLLPDELIEESTGSAANATALVDHLKSRYLRA